VTHPAPGEPVWALIAGGGTGGHIIPALAIGQALVARGHPASSVWFVGSDRELDRQLIPAAGFRLVALPGRGIVRGWTWHNVKAAAGLLRATARALALVHRTRPKVVVAVGGYASFACALAAVLCRVPLVVAEQNAAPGLVNRLAGRFAVVSAVSFEGTPLPKAVVTGNPVRPEIAAIDRSDSARRAARTELGLPVEGRVVAAAGGSLGARRINEAVAQLVALWHDRPGIAIRHVVGGRDRADHAQRTSALDRGGLVYQQVVFEDRMDLLLTAADVAVQRAGASTVSELTVAGLPSILVPLPGAPGDHQTVNARRLADAGAAVLVTDAELDGARLARELDRLLVDDELLSRMGAAARGLGHPDAAQAVAGLAEEYARA
jgi:UDP-N-acetylglucosamine--N-acetylmuramyl-(pentapeptide) pyrophosphoryl-undecaprenol N-acetylglucosamine transferase